MSASQSTPTEIRQRRKKRRQRKSRPPKLLLRQKKNQPPKLLLRQKKSSRKCLQRTEPRLQKKRPAAEAAPSEPAQAEPVEQAPSAEAAPEAAEQPSEEPAAEAPAEAEAPADQSGDEAASDAAPAAEEQPAADTESDAEATTSAADADVKADAEANVDAETDGQQPAAEADAAAEAEAEAGTTEPAAEAEEQPTADEPADEPAEASAAEQQESSAAPAEEAPSEEQATEQPAADTSAASEDVAPAPAPMDGEEASLTDSGKEAGVTAEEEATGEVQPTAGAEGATAEGGEAKEPVVVTTESAPQSDAEAQAAALPEDIEPVDAEKGQEITGERAAAAVRARPQDRKGSRVVGRFGDREIVQLASGALVVATVAALAANANDRDDRDRRGYVPRLRRDARDVTVEELRGGRYRETVERPNGVRVVTIYNEYGEVLRRTRISPDGVRRNLVYVPRDRWDRLRDPSYDPGADLPPLVVRIPRDEYILDVEEPVSRERYYDFLAQPPVETVERLYSVDEVRRSARIRDKVRRIDLGAVNFEFGKASISDSEIDELQNLAEAMERMLDRNPAETFLIEGHTDAVGSDAANLALSDARADSVASALTNVFGIPPENLETQGYGERYLKVRTEEPARENRRVAVRRITPLVSPENVARAQ